MSAAGILPLHFFSVQMLAHFSLPVARARHNKLSFQFSTQRIIYILSIDTVEQSVSTA